MNRLRQTVSNPQAFLLNLPSFDRITVGYTYHSRLVALVSFGQQTAGKSLKWAIVGSNLNF